MNTFSRRQFLKLTGGMGAAAAFGTLGYSQPAGAAKGAKVVIIGGGFGGATCAKYLRRGDSSLAVTLIEPSTRYITCPASNYYLGGFRSMESITQNYDSLRKKHGVTVVQDSVASIDPAAKKVKLSSGTTLPYDRLVVSPGIDFKWSAIEGFNEKDAEVMPHAWKAGPQTMLLRRKLEGMRNGGLFVIVAPPNPFRCPPGPYERASLVAHYFKTHKPKSKILILDPKDDFSKKGLFMDGWAKLYPGMIEWVPGAKGGAVKSVDTKKMIVYAFDKHNADVVNFIPAQTASAIAMKSGLADSSGWCPVDPKTFESKLHQGIHVIGDSSIAGALPKSAFAANSEAKICAAAIVATLKGQGVSDASYVNTCYSLITPKYGISVAGVYRVSDKGIIQIEGSGGASPKDATDGFREDEAKYAFGWYDSVSADVWG